MRRRFKSKRNHYFLIKSIIYMSFIYSLSNYLFSSISHDYNFLENPIHNFTVDRDSLLLKMGLNYREKKKPPNNFVFKEETEEVKPKIYIYNTHQTEEYSGYTLVEATNYLKSKLEELNVEVTIDDVNIKKILNDNNLTYKDSYKVTRNLIQDKNINDFGIIIDLHRDSSKRNITTTTINNINYARVMFVVGGSYNTYKNNYNLMDQLNKRIKSINPNLSRGIFLRKNSHFNQDLGNNIILIELGGVENTLEEVNNTADILSQVLADYLNE